MAHGLYALATDFRSKHRSEAVPPEPHRLVADLDPALLQGVLYVPKRRRGRRERPTQ